MPGIADILALSIAALLLYGAAHYYRVTRRAERMREIAEPIAAYKRQVEAANPGYLVSGLSWDEWCRRNSLEYDNEATGV